MSSTIGRTAWTALALSLAFATSASAQSLRDVVAHTLQTNPELGAIRYNRQAIDQELQAAGGLGRPRLDARAAGGHRSTDNSRIPGGTGPVDARARNRGDVGVTLSQPLFDGFETRSQIERQTNRVLSARSRVDDTANAVALQAVQAYLEIQRTTAVRAIAAENLAAHERLLARVKTRAEGGRGPGAEVSQANARYNAARAALADADARQKDARALYLTIVGKAPGKLQAVKPPSHRLPKTVDTAVIEAQKGAPAVVARMFDVAAADSAIDVARAAFYPKVSAEVSGDFSRDVDRYTGRRSDITGMIVLRQNLYNGGIDTARVEEARKRAEEAREIARNAGRSVERDVRIAWNAIQSSQVRIGAIGRQLDSNRKVITAYREQFDLGQRTLLDLLDIQNEIFVNASVLATERFVSQFNVYRVLASMGRLVDAFELSLPDEARAQPLVPLRIIP